MYFLLYGTFVQCLCSVLNFYHDCKRYIPWRNNYQGTLCIQNVTRFNGISINVIPFTSIRTVRPSLRRFSNPTYKCSTVRLADTRRPTSLYDFSKSIQFDSSAAYTVPFTDKNKH